VLFRGVFFSFQILEKESECVCLEKVVLQIPKRRVTSIYVRGEETWCTLGICNEKCGF
jgi:hypothetical protein